MNSQPPGEPVTNGRPVLAPRPIARPVVDPGLAAAFGRPPGAPGSFTAHPIPQRTIPQRTIPQWPVTQVPVVPDMLVDAFARPDSGPSLGRPPEQFAPPPEPEPEPPWRDPGSSAQLGAPALAEPEPETEPEPQELPTAPRYTLRELLWERRLRPSALIGLLVLCLVVGAGGAVVGGLLVSRTSAGVTDPAFTLAPVAPAVERPAGSTAAIAQKVLPAVVSIEVRAGDSGDTGSGVVIDGKGYVLTNNHVVSLAAADSSSDLSVVFNDGSRASAKIVGRDTATDLAVVKVDATNLVVAQLGESSKLQVGDPVIAVGSPLGLSGTVTSGIVSALHRPVRLAGAGTDTNAVIDAVQTDASVNPGNSGGPLIDGTGAVVGINTAIRTLGSQDQSGSIGLGFAIPIDFARGVAEELIRTGKAVHPTIGLNTRSATDGSLDGAQVANVVDGGPAAAAGIAEGDLIVKVGDMPIRDADDLAVAVIAHKVGDKVPVSLLRSGRSMTVEVTLTAA